jgi:hypothetical protein
MKSGERGQVHLAGVIQRIRVGWTGSAWEWDERLACALSTVPKPEEVQSLALLAGQLGEPFTPATVRAAPAALLQICARTGGLRASQLAFATTLSDGATAFCLWWPWASGGSFSARVGAGDDLAPLVRSAFGLT